MDTSRVKVYGYRWVVLLAFMFINLTIQILWICFAPITGLAAEHYHVSDLQIGFLAMSFMIVYIPMAIPASWAIDTFGFRKAVGFGAILFGVFGLLRGIYADDFNLTLWLTIGIAAGQPFLLSAWAKVAAKWFALEERATAVGLAAVASFLGIAIGQVLTPLLVLQSGFRETQLIYGALAAVSALLFLILAREDPPTPASPPGYDQPALMLDGLRQILRQRDFYYLALVLFVGGGIFNGVSTWVESIVRPKGMSITEAGEMGGIMLIGGIVGAAVLPIISDRLRKRKMILLLGVACSIPGLAGLTLGSGYVFLLISFFFLGVFLNGVAPVAYQYGAEITYPVPEGTSNGLFMLAGQISVVFIYGMGWFESVSGSFTPSLLALIGLMGVGWVVLTLLKESPMMQSKPLPALKDAREGVPPH
ncbi:MAG: MFS transporter [Chloroflexota bacterium]|nr:MFS transporter [Chloroflexota bacterium]